MASQSDNAFLVYHRDEPIPGVGKPYVIVVAWRDDQTEECFAEAYTLVEDERGSVGMGPDWKYEASFSTDGGATAKSAVDAANQAADVAQGQLRKLASAYWEQDRTNRELPPFIELPAVQDKGKALRQLAAKPNAAEHLRAIQRATTFSILRQSLSQLLASQAS